MILTLLGGYDKTGKRDQSQLRGEISEGIHSKQEGKANISTESEQKRLVGSLCARILGIVTATS